jgi:uncharacterized OB-fold protein
MTEIQIPPADDVTAPWWDATRQRSLLVQVCECGNVQFPPRALCLRCGSMDGLGWRQSSGQGTVDSWTAVHRSADPAAELPYVIARVRLTDGPLLLTRLVGSNAEEWQIDDVVTVVWLGAEDGRALPVFRKAES